MKIILTGGGTGGHFYPLIAVARSLKDIAERERIVNLDMVYAAPDPYDPDTLSEENIKFLSLPAGKIRKYFFFFLFFFFIKKNFFFFFSCFFDIILDILSELVDSFQVIHVAGKNNVQDIKMRSEYVLSKSPHAKRHHLYGFLREGDLRNASRVASLVIARAGGGTIFEIAAWGIPSILIPLPSAAQDHQRENAYLYAREGGAVVMEEKNLKPHLLLSEVNKIFSDEKRRVQMSKAAGAFAKLDGADVIAEEIIHIALGHA